VIARSFVLSALCIEVACTGVCRPNATNGGCDVLKGCKGDGCHPDDMGHHKIAEVVAKALASTGVL
jgi:hypothetical protein